MTLIRVDPAQLRGSASTMASMEGDAKDMAGSAIGITSGAPSYDGQFGPEVHAIGSEAAARLRSVADVLGARKEFLVRKASDFEAADQAVVTGFEGIALPTLPVTGLSNLLLGGGPGTLGSIPRPPWLSEEAWRKFLETLSANPPESISDIESAFLNAGMDAGDLARYKELYPGALPAIFSVFALHPDVAFTSDLQFQLTPDNCDITFEHFGQGSFYWSVAVVNTSLVRLLGLQPDLAATYGVSDVPITMRITMPPVPASLRRDQTTYDTLNRQLQNTRTVSLFLHGYQSTREVWSREMQTWMDLSDVAPIGIALGGMGNEGDGLGDGNSPFFPRQYAFQTMETLDLLGLYGKDINVIGHSMGGAAAMHMGITIDEMDTANVTHMRYVLLAPAVGPESCPFLKEGFTSFLINWQNSAGIMPGQDEEMRRLMTMSQAMMGPEPGPAVLPSDLAHVGNYFLGHRVVEGLIPGAPDYIIDVHAGFAGEYGFEPLAATAEGLVSQGYPDPAAVKEFLDNNPVLVVAANQDQLVDPDVVRSIFGPNVLSVDGNHYAHLPNSADPRAAGSPPTILNAAQILLNQPFPVPATAP